MSNSDSELSEDEGIVSESIRESARLVTLNLLPDKSKRLYTKAYNEFNKWRKEKRTNSFCEDVFLAYFFELSSKYVPTSLWATYFMLRFTVNSYDNIDIDNYKKVIAFLKKNNVGYQPNKAAVFTKENISRFLSEACDKVHYDKK